MNPAEAQKMFADSKALTIDDVAARDDWFPPNWSLANTPDNRRAICEMLLAKSYEVLSTQPNGKGCDLRYISSPDFGSGGDSIGFLVSLPFAGNKSDGPFSAGMALSPFWLQLQIADGPPQSLADVERVLADPKNLANKLLSLCSNKKSYSFEEAHDHLRIVTTGSGLMTREDIQVKFINPHLRFENDDYVLGLRIELGDHYRSVNPKLLQAWTDESGMSAEAICDLAALNTAAALSAPVQPASSLTYLDTAIQSGKLEEAQLEMIENADKFLPLCLFFAGDENGPTGRYISALMNFPQYLFADIPAQGLLLAAPSESEIMALRLDCLVPPKDREDEITIERIEQVLSELLDMFACVALFRAAYDSRQRYELYYWSPAYPDGLRPVGRYSDAAGAISNDELIARAVEPMRSSSVS